MEKQKQVYKIDAQGKAIGRLASEIAILLRGKNSADFLYHEDKGNVVEVENIKKVKFTGKKLDQKKYYHYSGYPGGLKEEKLRQLFQKNPGEVLRQAVYRMLPKNKLRDKMIKRLLIK